MLGAKPRDCAAAWEASRKWKTSPGPLSLIAVTASSRPSDAVQKAYPADPKSACAISLSISLCILLFSVFTTAAGLTKDPVTFSVMRFIAGPCIGGVMPNITEVYGSAQLGRAETAMALGLKAVVAAIRPARVDVDAFLGFARLSIACAMLDITVGRDQPVAQTLEILPAQCIEWQQLDAGGDRRHRRHGVGRAEHGESGWRGGHRRILASGHAVAAKAR